MARRLGVAALVFLVPALSAAQAPAPGQRLAPVPLVSARDRVLVMPFDNPGGEGRTYWLREAASVLIAEDVTAAGGSPIGREERLRAFERLGVSASATLSDATVIKIGELLGASTVVIGSLGLEADQLTVRARSIRLDTGRVQGEASETLALPQLFTLFDRVFARLFPLLPPLAGHGERDHAPLAAFESYIKGLVAETPASQVKFLQAALKNFPDYEAPRLALWQVYAAQGEHTKALAVALDVRTSSGVYRRGRFLAALSDIHLKQYDQALSILQPLTAQEPAATVLNNMGVAQLRRGSSAGGGSSASYYFNKANELSPGDPDYAFNLGYSYLLERDWMAAAHWLREAVRANPADGEAHYALGVALASTNAATEGAREKELARRLSSRFADWDRRPSSDPVPRGLERIKDDLDAVPASRAFAFETTEQKDQQALAAYYLDRGRRLFEQENDRDAASELQRVIYLSPYQAEAHLLLGRINLRTGRVREAIDDLKISLWSQETAAAHVALGEAYLRAKDSGSALAEAQRALALDPKSGDAQKLLARIGGK